MSQKVYVVGVGMTKFEKPGSREWDYPDMADFLVRIGIDSMSLNPDTVVKTTRRVLELERQLVPAP